MLIFIIYFDICKDPFRGRISASGASFMTLSSNLHKRLASIAASTPWTQGRTSSCPGSTRYSGLRLAVCITFTLIAFLKKIKFMQLLASFLLVNQIVSGAAKIVSKKAMLCVMRNTDHIV